MTIQTAGTWNADNHHQNTELALYALNGCNRISKIGYVDILLEQEQPVSFSQDLAPRLRFYAAPVPDNKKMQYAARLPDGVTQAQAEEIRDNFILLFKSAGMWEEG